MYISSRVNEISESVTLKLNAKANQLAASGQKIFNLTAGQLPIKPPEELSQLVTKELDFLESYQYSPSSGFNELRDKFIQNLERKRGINFSDLDKTFGCTISNGGKHSLLNVLLAILERDDEVILLSPFWITYPEMVKICRAKPVVVDSDVSTGFVPDIEKIKKAITKKTKAIVVNSPNNPSGIFYPEKWMDDFAELISDYPELIVISDEIYDELYYDGVKPTYFYQKNPKLLLQTIIVDSISKTLACPGIRLG